MRKRILAISLLLAVCLLSACEIRTVEQMYCLPKRPQSYNDLQSVIDSAMADMEYSAPRTGENQQTVQMADLDGDGIREYLLFAKSEGEKPLRILIFAESEESFTLVDTVQCNGASFDVVEYVQMDGHPGMELVIGCQLNDQVPRSVSVYTFSQGKAQQVFSTSYAKLLPCDLDADGCGELLVIRPGATAEDAGVAQLYSMEDGTAYPFDEVSLSCTTGQLKQILSGQLQGGIPAIFVSAVRDGSVITDIFALSGDVFVNIPHAVSMDTAVPFLHGQGVYAEDIDGDGEVELPELTAMLQGNADEMLIQWYSPGADGARKYERITYHDHEQGWYLELDREWASRISVAREGNECAFYLWSEDGAVSEKIFSIFVLRGQNREEQAVLNNRFVVHKSEAVIYAARLEVASGMLNISQQDLINNFHLIRQAWKSGEM